MIFLCFLEFEILEFFTSLIYMYICTDLVSIQGLYVSMYSPWYIKENRLDHEITNVKSFVQL